MPSCPKPRKTTPLAFNRRQVMQGTVSLAGASLLRGFAARAEDEAAAIFTHGVASGDPMSDKVILWTRVIPSDGAAKKLNVIWEIAADSSFTKLLHTGKALAGPASDYTVKVDAAGLAPDTIYYYRFKCDSVISMSGQTRTLPVSGTDAFQMAVVSCSNYPQGYFHVYKEISKRDFNLVVHLGDYIYEYPEGTYSNAKMTEEHGRHVEPRSEVIALEDYRMRYGLYRTDPDLQAVHARHPFICVWDDHEIANDTWRTGAQNHNENEGLFEDRKKAALRAYHEWLPIREHAEKPVATSRKARSNQEIIFRTFDIGDLATLIMLDTRLYGRDKPLNYAVDLKPRTQPFHFAPGQTPIAVTDAELLNSLRENPETASQIRDIPIPFKMMADGKAEPILDWARIKELDPKALPKGTTYLPDIEHFKTNVLSDPSRHMLGAEQEAWLDAAIAHSKQSGKKWQILGQQVLVGKVGIPLIQPDEIEAGKSVYLTPERVAQFRMLGEMGLPLNMDAWDGYPAARDRLFALAKKHDSNMITLAGDTHNAWAFNLKDKDGHAVGVEFATAGVSSPGLEEYLPVSPELVVQKIKDRSPELHYMDGQNRGWLELSVGENSVDATWQFVTTVHEKAYSLQSPTHLSTHLGSNKIT